MKTWAVICTDDGYYPGQVIEEDNEAGIAIVQFDNVLEDVLLEDVSPQRFRTRRDAVDWEQRWYKIYQLLLLRDDDYEATFKRYYDGNWPRQS